MNHHFANAGDVMKHLALMSVAAHLRPRRYLESHAGAFDYALRDREGPLPDGVWDFAEKAPAVLALAASEYGRLIGALVGSPNAPGTYPGSLRCVWEVLGTSAEYHANDTDTEAVASLAFELEARATRGVLAWADGIDMVIDEARPADLVLIDPFDPGARSTRHGLTAAQAFDALVDRGATVLLWRALDLSTGEPDDVAQSDLSIRLVFHEATGSMDGCELLAGNLPPDAAAEIAALATAHGAILTNGRVTIGARSAPKRDDRRAVVARAERTWSSSETMFDRYVMVDWSARSTPSRATPSPDAIWVGDLSCDGQAETYCRTRAIASEVVSAVLRYSLEREQRVLIGFDFPFGYPRGFAAALGMDIREPWKALWLDLSERITDNTRNANNRFEVARAYNQRVSTEPGPFWGCPAGQGFGGLTPTSAGLITFPYRAGTGEIAKFRATEIMIPGAVQETWKLMGTGSVGSQALVGINRVARLRFNSEFEDMSCVWPFETGLEAPALPPGSARIVFAEIWPGIVDGERLAALMDADLIKDQAQVRLMCEWAHRHDRAGTLGDYLSPPQACNGHADAVVSEEGWILGCL